MTVTYTVLRPIQLLRKGMSESTAPANLDEDLVGPLWAYQENRFGI